MKNDFTNGLVSVVIVTKDRKKDLRECLVSYLKSSYTKIEIIIVDNGSKPSLTSWLVLKNPKVRIFTSESNVGAAGGRNIGLSQARGEYILFTDDDAVAEKEMISHLVHIFNEQKDAGIVQPLVYDKNKKNMLQGAGHDIDLTTGRIKAWGVRELDQGQYEGLREIPMSGCVWMVKREVFEKIGDYDVEYHIPYEDSDFSFRVRTAGFKIYCYSKAKSWHQGVKTTFVHPWIEWLGITSPERAFRIGRNKIIFITKHSPFVKKIVFFSLFLPGYLLLHSLIILASRRVDILNKYWKGIISGLVYTLRKLFDYLTQEK